MSKLQQEIGKRGPFGSPGQEAVLNLFRTSDRLQHRFARLFAEYDMTSSQYNILRILRGEGRPMQCMEIAERTITVVPGITGLIDRLERKVPALVTRERSREDRRDLRLDHPGGTRPRLPPRRAVARATPAGVGALQ